MTARASMAEIARHVAASYGISPEALGRPGHHLAVSEPRRVAALLARHLTPHGYGEIGHRLGGLHPKSVSDGIVRLSDRIGTDEALEARLAGILDALDAGHLAGPLRLRAAPAAGPKAKRRPCLRCRADFDSSGPENRLCAPCCSTVGGMNVAMAEGF